MLIASGLVIAGETAPASPHLCRPGGFLDHGPQRALAAPAAWRHAGSNQEAVTFTPDGAVAVVAGRDGAWGARGEEPGLWISRRVAGAWQDAEPLALTGIDGPTDPFVAADGRLFLTASSSGGNLDIHVAPRREGGWGRPVPLPAPVNSPAAEYRPVLLPDGRLLLASGREGGAGLGDLYVSLPVGDGFGPPRLLSPPSTGAGEWNALMEPAGRWLLFEASGRPEGVSAAGDLYVSWNREGRWSEPRNVRLLNGPGSELNAALDPGGRFLWYASTSWSAPARARIFRAPVAALARYCPNLRRELFVANRSSGTLLAVDLESGTRRTVEVGPGPHLLATDRAGRWVVTAGYGVFPERHDAPVDRRPPWRTVAGSGLWANEAGSAEALSHEACARPHGVATDGERAWVTCEEDGTVVELSLAGGRSPRTLPATPGVHTLSVAPGGTVFAANPDLGHVVAIEPGDAERRIIETGPGAEGMTQLPWRNELWVANGQAGTVSVVDTGSLRIKRELDLGGGFPIALAPTPDGLEVWVARFAAREITVLDETGVELAVVPLDHQPLNIAFDPATQNAFVSLPRRNAVLEIDRYSRKILRRHEVGSEPDGLVVVMRLE